MTKTSTAVAISQEIVGNRMTDMLFSRQPLEIGCAVVSLVAIFVVNLWSVFGVWHKGLRYQAVKSLCGPELPEFDCQVSTRIGCGLQNCAVTQRPPTVPVANFSVDAPHSAEAADLVTRNTPDGAPDFAYPAMGHGSLLRVYGQGPIGRGNARWARFHFMGLALASTALSQSRAEAAPSANK